MHVILLDNGRSRMLRRGYADATLCIRCGACVNVCPVYREIGGHTYGCTPYSGPIGAVITPLLADDVTSARELPFASSLCGACRDACPVKIDLPRLLLDLRSEMTERKAVPAFERIAIRAYTATITNPRRYQAATRIARWISRLLAGRRDDISRMPPPLRAWTRTRDLPKLPRKSFRSLWRDQSRAGGENYPNE
jgi:L-lactate dehydrogenase complex protein LldF